MELTINTCRLCLDNSELNKPMFEELSEYEINELIDSLKIDINADDTFTAVCSNCVLRVNSMYNALSDFREADKIYKSLLENHLRKEASLCSISFVSFDDNTGEIPVEVDIKTEKESGSEAEEEQGNDYEHEHGCLYCDETFGTEKALAQHNKQCRGYNCSVCEGSFEFLVQWKKHRKSHDKNTLNNYREEYKNYMEKMKAKKKEIKKCTNECNICGTRANNDCRLAAHYMKEHSEMNIKLFSCDICPLKFTTLDKSKNHRTRHQKEFNKNRKKRKSYNVCEICSKSFTYDYELLKHLRSEHPDTETQVFPCTQCSRTYTSMQKLTKHIYNIHNEKRPQFVCLHCGKKYDKKLTLRDHENTHRGVTDYKCVPCDKVFTYRSTYARHCKTVHSEEKKFVCEFCFKSFKRRPNLNVHRRIHTGEKPCVCHFCNASFIDTSVLNKHRQKEHNVPKKVMLKLVSIDTQLAK